MPATSQRFNFKIMVLLLLCLSALGCQKKKKQVVSSTPSEIAYCPYLPSLTFGGGVTISGNFKYEYRPHKTTGAGGLDNPTAGSVNPIRFAEVRVTDSAGTLIQCDETDANGDFSFQLPQSTSTTTVSIASRAYNNKLRASVLDHLSTNNFYTYPVLVTADSTKSIGSITVPATGEIKGAAFNILDQMYLANEYLRNQTTGCGSAPFTDCTDFTVAPKVTAYWKAGFNPGSYFGQSSVSFYLQGESMLFILGGLNGNVSSADTDHFDNSIIIHEYGHFIEDIYADTDSPGGQHSGNSVIDPRLAWGEGWANFFQAAVRGSPDYIDTLGHAPTTSDIFDVDIETADRDFVDETGEGMFREFSVSRLFWDSLDAPNDGGNDTVTATFSELWNIFAGTTNGFRSSSTHYRYSGLFLKKQSAVGGGSNFTSIRNHEFHLNNLSEYATPLVSTPGGTCTVSINADPDNDGQANGEDGSFATSNQLLSNDFYVLQTSGGAVSVRMVYDTPGADDADLDLYVYREGYTYGSGDDAVGVSDAPNTGAGADGGDELASMSLSAGHYMINVKVFTGSMGADPGDSSNYYLEINGVRHCPNP